MGVLEIAFNTKRREAGEMRVELSDGCVEGEEEVRSEENFYGRGEASR